MTLVQKVYLPSLFSHMNTGKFRQLHKLQGTESVPVAMTTIKKTPPESQMASFMKEAAIKREEVTMREKVIMHSFFQDGEKTVTWPQISCGYFSTM